MKELLASGVLFDAFCILLLVLGLVTGWKRGFVRTVYRFFRVIASGLCAFFLAKPLASLLQKTSLYESLRQGLTDKLTDFLLKAAPGGDAGRLFDGTNETISGILSAFGKSAEELNSAYAGFLADGTQNAAQGVVTLLVEPAVGGLLTVLCFLIIFAVCLFVLWLVMLLLGLVTEIPGLSFINHFFGAVAGLIVAAVEVYLFYILFKAALPYLEGLDIGITQETITHSILYSLLSGAPVTLPELPTLGKLKESAKLPSLGELKDAVSQAFRAEEAAG